MPALGRLHAVAAALSPQVGHPEAGAGADHAERAVAAQRRIGAGEVQELAIIRARHGMGDSGEIIDQREALHPEFFIDQRGADDPRIIGEADDSGEVAGGAHGPCNRHAHRRRQSAALAHPEGFPCGL